MTCLSDKFNSSPYKDKLGPISHKFCNSMVELFESMTVHRSEERSNIELEKVGNHGKVLLDNLCDRLDLLTNQNSEIKKLHTYIEESERMKTYAEIISVFETYIGFIEGNDYNQVGICKPASPHA